MTRMGRRFVVVALAWVVGLYVLGLVTVHWQWIIVHLSQETGTSNSASRSYDFWSGFGSDIGELALIGGVIALFRHHNCHQPGCWRIGKHTTAKGHKLCKKHVAIDIDDLNLHEVHPSHLA